MRYVLDSCVALKWVLPEPHTAKAIHVRDDFRQQLVTLIAPDVFPIEAAHALAKAERRKVIPPGSGLSKLADLFRYLPTLHASYPLLNRAFDIASSFKIGVYDYDCLYVALAEQEGCEFLTADDRLVRTLQPTYPFIVSLATLP
jgi:predicted nucleic acid-binding protein